MVQISLGKNKEQHETRNIGDFFLKKGRGGNAHK